MKGRERPTRTWAVVAVVGMLATFSSATGCERSAAQVMPDVTGMTLREAVAVLGEEGIEPEHTYGHYGVVEVVATEPAAGEPIRGPVSFTMAKVTATKVVDGDSLELSTGDRVRLIGIDTPELGECGSVEATAFLTRRLSGKRLFVDNPTAVEDRDRHGRLLAYIGTPVINDIGYQLVRKGLAVPRYNSGDGYGGHPAEKAYETAASRARTFTCGPPPPRSSQEPPSSPMVRPWTCSYAPTFDNDWHNDVLCTDGERYERPYLRPGDSFVTESEIMSSAEEYERHLNGQ